MKILQLTSHLDVGGITRYVLSLSEQLRQRGHQVIIAADGGRLEARAQAAGLAHWPLPLHTSMEFSLPVFQAARQLHTRLHQEPVDLIHAHTRVAQVLAASVSSRMRIPYVTTWHGIYKRRLGRRLWPCMGALTIAISQPVHEHLLHCFHVPEACLRLIYNGIDTAHYARLPEVAAVHAYRERLALSAHQPIIGGIGRIASGRVKGFDLLLAAASLLREDFPNLQVVIVGDGPRRPFLDDVARRLRIRARVHFVGEVDDIRLPLALLDVFVFSSRWPEAFGLALIEAMAAGRPVVALRSGAVSDIIDHGTNGWLVPVNDPSALAEGIARLLRDPAMAARLGHQAQERVKEAFSLERMAKEVEAVYREVLAVSKRAEPDAC